MGGTSEESPSGVKYFRLAEIEEQKSIKSTWIIINYKVYDVTKFLEEVRAIEECSRGHNNQTMVPLSWGKKEECVWKRREVLRK